MPQNCGFGSSTYWRTLVQRFLCQLSQKMTRQKAAPHPKKVKWAANFQRKIVILLKSLYGQGWPKKAGKTVTCSIQQHYPALFFFGLASRQNCPFGIFDFRWWKSNQNELKIYNNQHLSSRLVEIDCIFWTKTNICIHFS